MTRFENGSSGIGIVSPILVDNRSMELATVVITKKGEDRLRLALPIPGLYPASVERLLSLIEGSHLWRARGREELVTAAADEALELGSTLSDGTYRNALNITGGYQNHHRVYSRADQPCLRCQGGKIKRIVQAQRSTFFCAKCQKKR